MQLSPSVSRLLGRRCKEEKENRALSRCQCPSGLAKIRCKTSSRPGMRSSCRLICVSQRGRHFCRDHMSTQWLSRTLQMPKLLHISQQELSSCSAKHRRVPAANQRGSLLTWLSYTPNHTQLFPYPPTALGYLALSAHISILFTNKKIFECLGCLWQ